MNKWKSLDMRKKDQRPDEGALFALRMVSKTQSTLANGERYDTGKLKLDREGKKLWLHHASGISDPVRLKQSYDIWWCYINPFDGI